MDENTTPPPGLDSGAPPPPSNEPPPSPTASRRNRKRMDPVTGPSDPPPPLAGGPVPDDASSRPSNPAAAKAAKVTAKAAALTQVVDPKATAKQLVQLADGLIGALMSSRYGEMVDANTGKSVVEMLAVTDQEREAMAVALALVIQTSVGGMSPMVAFLVSFGATYGARVAILEPSLAKAKRHKRAQGG